MKTDLLGNEISRASSKELSNSLLEWLGPEPRHLTESGSGQTQEEVAANRRVEELIHRLLIELGEDPTREGLQLTSSRVRKSLAFLTGGYSTQPREVLGTAIFEENYDEMVLVRDIEMYSMCEHHMLPFYGKCHIAYIPDGKIVGRPFFSRGQP